MHFKMPQKKFALMVLEANRKNPINITIQNNEFYMYLYYLTFYSDLVKNVNHNTNIELSLEQLSELKAFLEDDDAEDE